MLKRKIIVITPIKNERWVLHNFLSACSAFADHIILADQNSTDDSLAIAANFKKAIVINNPSKEYDESSRQLLLIKTARELFPGVKVILALDADEIITAKGLISFNDWEHIQKAEIGTVLKFNKPDLFLSNSKYVDNSNEFSPLGFIDDDKINHQPRLIHSIRVPLNKDSKELILKDIQFLHLAYLRPNYQRAKFRFYSVKENLIKNSPWYRRRRVYKKSIYPQKKYTVLDSPNNWFNYPNELEIDLKSIIDDHNCWCNYDVLNTLNDYGSFKFWLDDIWDIDWNKFAKEQGILLKNEIKPPLFPILMILKLFDKINN